MPVRAPAGAAEITDLRSIRGKVFDRGNGVRRASVGMEILHVPNDVQAWLNRQPIVWEEINERPVFDPRINKFVVARTWYTLEVDPDRFFLQYISRITGQRTTVELKRLNGTPLASATFAAEVRGNDVVFPDVVPGLDLMVRTYTGGVETFKRLKSLAAPRSFEWEVTEEAAIGTSARFVTRGLDNADMLDAGRNLLSRKRRAIELATTHTQAIRGSRRVHTYTETWSGRTFAVDPNTRLRSPSNEVVFPVLVDATLQEDIVADNDDGTDDANSNTWDALYHYYYGGMNYALAAAGRSQTGWRFQSLAGPASGDTVNSATLTIHVNKVGAGGVTATIYGYLTASAAAWSNTVRPEVVAHTTASVSQALTTVGTKIINVTSIVQELFDQAAWASGNNLSLFVDGGSGDGTAFIDERDSTLNQSAVLDVDYTAGGGGATVIDLTAASFAVTPATTQPRTALALTSATWNATAQPVQLRASTSLTAATLNLTAQAVTVLADFVVDLTAAAFAYTAQAAQLATRAALTSAVLRFTAQAVEVTGAIAAVARNLLWLYRRRRDR